MKTRTFILFVALISLNAFAQPADSTSRVKRKILEWRIHVHGASREPYRKVNEKVYDLTPFFIYSQCLVDDPDFAESAPAPSGQWEDWGILFGTVLQVLDEDGILLRKYDDSDKVLFEGKSHIVRLKNFPRGRTLVDGAKLAVFAYLDGRYSYVNTGGARSTVESYDYGKLVTGEELDKFKSKVAAETAARQQGIQNMRIQQEKTLTTKQQEAAQRVLEFYSQKATNGDGAAQLRLGEIYLRGQGVETNLPLAQKWLSMALTNGCPQATNLLQEIELNSRPSQ